MTCGRDPRVAVVPVGDDSGTGSAATIDSVLPRLERRGAVLTVLTRVGPGAPAATRDQVALIAFTFTSGGSRDHLELPPGGGGVLHLARTEATGSLLVQLFDPRRETVGHNHLDLEGLAGSVGVVAFEVTSREPALACRLCGAPEPLTAVRGLVDTHLYWSAWSQVVSGEPGEPLFVATRADAAPQELQDLFEGADLRILNARFDEDERVMWTLVRPSGPQTAVDVAVALAPRALVKALWLGEDWPDFWPEFAPEPLGLSEESLAPPEDSPGLAE
jgi:hypothetical protein